MKVFLTVAGVSVILITLYSLTDFLLAFKERSVQIAVRYILNLLPIGFYILSPILINVSLLLFVGRLLSKNIDLTAQSFSLSPLRLSATLILWCASLSAFFLALNENFFPSLFRDLWHLEKTFKKKQEVGFIVERLWFLKETERGRYFVYIGTLDTRNGRFADLFLLRTSAGGKPVEVVEGISGSWREYEIRVDRGSAYNFEEGYSIEELTNFFLGTEISVGEVGVFAQKIEHVRTSSLINLYLKGSRLGFDTNRYLSEILYRAGMSVLSLMIMIPLLRVVLGRRSIKVGAFYFLILLVVGWFVIVSPKVLTEKANLSPLYALGGYAVLLAYVLKGLYDLRKGFRV